MKSCAFSVTNCTQTIGEYTENTVKNLIQALMLSVVLPQPIFHKTRKCLIALGVDSPTPNFTKIRLETRKLQDNISLRPYVKYGCQRADFRGTRVCFTNHVTRTAQPAKSFGRRYQVTGGQKDGRGPRKAFQFCARKYSHSAVMITPNTCYSVSVQCKFYTCANCVVRSAVTEL